MKILEFTPLIPGRLLLNNSSTTLVLKVRSHFPKRMLRNQATSLGKKCVDLKRITHFSCVLPSQLIYLLDLGSNFHFQLGKIAPSCFSKSKGGQSKPIFFFLLVRNYITYYSWIMILVSNTFKEPKIILICLKFWNFVRFQIKNLKF